MSGAPVSCPSTAIISLATLIPPFPSIAPTPPLTAVIALRHVHCRDDMEHWKLGATDVLAKARQELVSTSVQPLESRLSEVSTVLSVSTNAPRIPTPPICAHACFASRLRKGAMPGLQGVVKNTSNAQLAVLNLENRLDSHVKEYTADKASDRDTIAAGAGLAEGWGEGGGACRSCCLLCTNKTCTDHGDTRP